VAGAPHEHVQRIILNDADPCVFAFWKTLLNNKDDFIRRFQNTPITTDEWKRQREIYRHQARHSRTKVALATFYLNRCNRSGIIVNGGPIGGLEQAGKWKIDARFNKDDLIRRIEKVHLYRDRIDVYNMDAIEFLENVIGRRQALDDVLVYLDPPYYTKGSRLYLNHYCHEDHAQLAAFIKRPTRFHWLMTYDNVPEINELYRDCRRIPFHLSYSAHSYKTGSELLIHKATLAVPDELLMRDHTKTVSICPKWVDDRVEMAH